MAKKPGVEKVANADWTRVAVLWRCAERGNAIRLALETEMPEDLWPEGMAAFKIKANIY